MEEITCPFCGETDFDKIGLKIHLTCWCELYRNTPMHDPLTGMPEDIADRPKEG